MRADAIVVSLALTAACSARTPYGGAPQQLGTVDGRHQEITALWTQIRQWRLDARLAVEPSPALVDELAAVTAADVAATCELAEPTAGTCREICDLGDAICDNASAICRIADDLPGDDWARDKCDSAKASCREAEERCCACRRPDGGLP
jgi:hypothetical protein